MRYDKYGEPVVFDSTDVLLEIDVGTLYFSPSLQGKSIRYFIFLSSSCGCSKSVVFII